MNVEILITHTEKYKIPVSNIALFQQAMTHRSALSDGMQNDISRYNESIEFLGDTILGFVIADFLYQEYPDKNEGYLSKIKGYVVSRDCLYKVAVVLGLDKIFQILGVSLQEGVFSAPLADSVEAVIGAVYLDKGLDVAREFVLRHFKKFIDDVVQGTHHKDYKSLLQHYTQSSFQNKPLYAVVGTEGPDHNREYCVEVSVVDINSEQTTFRAQGRAGSVKKAEQYAAQEMCEHLAIDDDSSMLF